MSVEGETKALTSQHLFVVDGEEMTCEIGGPLR